MDKRWCDNCGNPGPFNDKTCLTCYSTVKEFITEQKVAYKLWLDYQRITGRLKKTLEDLNDV